MKEIIIYPEPILSDEARLTAQTTVYLGQSAMHAIERATKGDKRTPLSLSDSASAAQRRLRLTTVTQSFDTSGSAIIPRDDGGLVRVESVGDGAAHIQAVTTDGQTTHLGTISRRQHDIDLA